MADMACENVAHFSSENDILSLEPAEDNTSSVKSLMNEKGSVYSSDSDAESVINSPKRAAW